jgi:WD40 repeat protein
MPPRGYPNFLVISSEESKSLALYSSGSNYQVTLVKDEEVVQVALPSGRPNSFALFSPDSNYQVTLVKCETETVQIFSVTDLTRPLITSEGKSLVTSLSFSLDSKFFTVTRDDGTIENYEFIASSQQIVPLRSCSTDSTAETM